MANETSPMQGALFGNVIVNNPGTKKGQNYYTECKGVILGCGYRWQRVACAAVLQRQHNEGLKFENNLALTAQHNQQPAKLASYMYQCSIYIYIYILTFLHLRCCRLFDF